MNLTRPNLPLLTLGLAAGLLSGCVFAPPVHVSNADDIAKMTDRANATCGAGQVKEVNTSSFTCK